MDDEEILDMMNCLNKLSLFKLSESDSYHVKRAYKKPHWAVQQVIRASGLVEDICIHGVGHPNVQWIEEHPEKSSLGIHGCDGCCSKDNDAIYDDVGHEEFRDFLRDRRKNYKQCILDE